MIGQKHDKQKPRMSLLPKGALNAVIRVLEFGATKYQENNWKHVSDAKVRYYDAMQRHIDAWWQGEQKDPETGEHHLAHAICCGMFLWWFDDQDVERPEAIANYKPNYAGLCMSDFENWFRNLNANGKTVYFFGNEHKVCKMAWNHQQAIIDNLKAQLNNMEACYIEKKKECERLQGRIDEALTWLTRTDIRPINCAREILRGAND